MVPIFSTIVCAISMILIFTHFGFSFSAEGATQSECLKLDSTHVKMIVLNTNCYWIVGSLADQGFVVTHVIATDTGNLDQNQVSGLIIMQNQGHVSVVAQSIDCHMVGKTRECLPV